MFRRICNPPKFTIRICNPLKLHIYIMMCVGERIANPHLETVRLQIRRNKWMLDMPCFTFQKAMFYHVKGHLLQAKRRPFRTTLIIKQLRKGEETPFVGT